MMTVSFITCILLTFTSLGVSLDCEVCTGIGDHCSGITTTCYVEEHRCGTMVIEGLGRTTVMKRCVPLSICSMGISTFDYGKHGFQRTAISCCAENECNKNEPKVPPRNTTGNGKMCPTCDGIQKDCVEEIRECVGDEVHCFEVSASASKPNDGVKISVAMKGCTNNAGCMALKQGETLLDELRPLGLTDLSPTVRCAGVALSSSISGLWRLLFPSLSGLLLMRFLA